MKKIIAKGMAAFLMVLIAACTVKDMIYNNDDWAALAREFCMVMGFTITIIVIATVFVWVAEKVDDWFKK